MVGDTTVENVVVGDVAVGNVAVGDVAVGNVAVGNVGVGSAVAGNVAVGSGVVGNVVVGSVVVGNAAVRSVVVGNAAVRSVAVSLWNMSGGCNVSRDSSRVPIVPGDCVSGENGIDSERCNSECCGEVQGGGYITRVMTTGESALTDRFTRILMSFTM